MAQNRKISIIPNCEELSQHSKKTKKQTNKNLLTKRIGTGAVQCRCTFRLSCPCAFQFIMAASLAVSVPSLPSASSAVLLWEKRCTKK